MSTYGESVMSQDESIGESKERDPSDTGSRPSDHINRSAVAQAMDEDGGWWKSCSGCHETNEGYETGHYPFSDLFRCHVGSGCCECGGLGVVWEYYTEAQLADMGADLSSRPGTSAPTPAATPAPASNAVTAAMDRREVLFFASYCGEGADCSPAKPCPVCLGMSNVYRVPVNGAQYVRALAPEWNTKIPPLPKGHIEEIAVRSTPAASADRVGVPVETTPHPYSLGHLRPSVEMLYGAVAELNRRVASADSLGQRLIDQTALYAVRAMIATAPAPATGAGQRPKVGASVLCEHAGRLLLGRAAQPSSVAGLWQPPAGGVEYGERVEDAALRELEEEAGVEARITGLAGVTQMIKPEAGKHKVIVTFHGEADSFDVRPNQEFDELRWFTPDDVAALAIAGSLTVMTAEVLSGTKWLLGSAPATGAGLYIASKTAHALRWRDLRAAGAPIISTWIDEAGQGETACFTDLWRRCVSEASTAAAVIVYREPGEALKGAFVEVGAALAVGKPVYAVGCDEFSFVHHANVRRCASLEEALDRASPPPANAEGR